MVRNGNGTKWLWYEMTCFGILHRWSYKGDVSLFFDFTVGYIQISFQESNSFICFLTDIRYMTFPLQVWCNCYAQAGFYKYDGRKLWLMINRFPDMDPYFTEINNVLLGSRGYEYDGFLLSKIYCFYFIKWQKEKKIQLSYYVFIFLHQVKIFFQYIPNEVSYARHEINAGPLARG